MRIPCQTQQEIRLFLLLARTQTSLPTALLGMRAAATQLFRADVDANKTADFTIVLTGVNPNLTASDFIL
jgi:hypothetical protein